MISHTGLIAAAKPSASSYQAQGVHFDGATHLINAALVSSDNGTASASIWFFLDDHLTASAIWVSDPLGGYDQYNFNNGDGFEALYGNSAEANNLDTQRMIVANGTWYNLITSADVRRATPVLTAYLTDALSGTPTIITGTFDGSSVLPFNGLEFEVGNDGGVSTPFAGSLADIWVAPGVSLLDGSGDIPPATRRKFIDGSGKPVYLGASGELPTGSSPAVFLSATFGGPASSFATNRGTGGAFTTTGTLTLASTNP